MKVTYSPHHRLTARYGAPYACALAAAGHDVRYKDGDVLLADGDWPFDPWKTWSETHEAAVLYPHGAGIVAAGHGQMPRQPSTRHQIVTGPGHVELAEIAGDVPTTAAGWPWTPLLPFRPATDMRRLFFAPPHASQLGLWRQEERDAWQVTGDALLAKFVPTEAGGTVEWDISQQVHMMEETVASILAADLVVTASSTVLCLAVALGCPAAFYGWGRDDFGMWHDHEEKMYYPPESHLPALLDAARYPFDLTNIDEAMHVEASDWRARFIGQPFDPALFVRVFDAAVTKEYA